MFAVEKQTHQPGRNQTLVTLVEHVAGTQDATTAELTSAATDIKEIWGALVPVRGTRNLELSKLGINQPHTFLCDYNLNLVAAGASKELNQRYKLRSASGIEYTIHSITNQGGLNTRLEILLSVRNSDVK